MELYTGGVGVIVYNNDGTKILLGKRTDGQGWSLCGGKKEGNEEPIETAIRESKEEFGIDIEVCDMHYIGQVYTKAPLKGVYTNIISNIFYTYKFSGDIVPQETEMEEIKWCGFEDILELDKIFIPTLASLNKFVLPL